MVRYEVSASCAGFRAKSPHGSAQPPHRASDTWVQTFSASPSSTIRPRSRGSVPLETEHSRSGPSTMGRADSAEKGVGGGVAESRTAARKTVERAGRRISPKEPALGAGDDPQGHRSGLEQVGLGA